MKLRPIVAGLLTFAPGLWKLCSRKKPGSATSAVYCYGVWLKHLTMLWESGLRAIPDMLVELGPGESIGVGLSALLCGTNHYIALDAVKHTNIETNLEIFDELVALFESRAKRPTKGWPDFDCYLNGNLFPDHILDEKRLKSSLDKKRLAAIRDAIEKPEHRGNGITVKYAAPWSDPNIVKKESADLILSHSSLEHVEDIEATYRSIGYWLKPGGLITHQLDYESHGYSDTWNGHLAYSEPMWKIIKGRRPYAINRLPHSNHIDLMRKNNFRIVCELKRYKKNGIQRSQLSNRWKHLRDDDLSCSGAFIQAQKRL